MPGIRSENRGVNGIIVNGVATDGSHGVSPGISQSHHHNEVEGQGSMQAEGRHDKPNGLLTNGDTASCAGGHAMPSSAIHPFRELPPEILHITAGYQPLSRLIVRLTQDTLRNLTEMISTMSELPVPQQNSHSYNQINGVRAAATPSFAKRQMLLNFGQERRAQFIKLLVLSQWSQKATDVSKVIDLKVWLDSQRALYEEAAGWLGEMKRNLAPARVPNPDLTTSLEVLSTGNASWLPDLGYLPPEPLSPRQMLKTLRNINTLLSIRLNLYDTLPTHFKNFSIASGRATFSVFQEFELDLSIADEDPSSQLYFIDFRFNFLPVSPHIPPGRLRDEVEGRTNDILKNEGLSACYDFLHEFILTHKIHILRTQAFEMTKGKWVESIRLETIRRTLILQYWLNRSGNKSWIEIGIHSGRRKDGNQILNGKGTSHIGLRWFRNGTEIENPSILFDLESLSMESILKSVISLHTSYILTSIANGLEAATTVYANRILTSTPSPTVNESANFSLDLQFTRSRSVSITLEPVTGRVVVLPASPLFARLEWELNGVGDIIRESPSIIARYRCRTAQDEIESTARCVGWESLKNLASKDEETRVFPRDTKIVCYFRRKGWQSKWVMATSINTSGEAWWILETRDAPTSRTFESYQSLKMQSRLGVAPIISYAFLLRLEHTAAGFISLWVHSRDLDSRRVVHHLVPTKTPPTLSSIDRSVAHIPVLYSRLSSLMAVSQSSPANFWAKEAIKITYRGVTTDTREAVTLVEADLANPINVTRNSDDDVAFNPESGAFVIKFRALVGESIVPRLLTRLKRIQRLYGLVAISQKMKLPCTTITLDRVLFTYHQDPHLQADIAFADGVPMTVSLSLSNPHLRIKDFLTSSLNSNEGLEHMVILLGVTFPILSTLDELERLRENNGLFVLPRAADWLQVRYKQPDCSFDVRLKIRRDQAKWFVHHGRMPVAGTTSNFDPDGFTKELKLLYAQNGNNWTGLGTGIAAEPDGIGEVLRKIHGLLEQFRNDATKGNGVAESDQPIPDREIVVLD